MTNIIIINGVAGKDPEVRQSKDSLTIVSFTVATSEGYKDKEGNWNNSTEWHNCVAFGKTAESIAKRLKKGDKVLVVGKSKTRKWQDKEGKDRFTTEITVEKADITKKVTGDNAKEPSAVLDPENGLVVTQDSDTPPF